MISDSYAAGQIRAYQAQDRPLVRALANVEGFVPSLEEEGVVGVPFEGIRVKAVGEAQAAPGVLEKSGYFEPLGQIYVAGLRSNYVQWRLPHYRPAWARVVWREEKQEGLCNRSPGVSETPLATPVEASTSRQPRRRLYGILRKWAEDAATDEQLEAIGNKLAGLNVSKMIVSDRARD